MGFMEGYDIFLGLFRGFKRLDEFFDSILVLRRSKCFIYKKLLLGDKVRLNLLSLISLGRLVLSDDLKILSNAWLISRRN